MWICNMPWFPKQSLELVLHLGILTSVCSTFSRWHKQMLKQWGDRDSVTIKTAGHKLNSVCQSFERCCLSLRQCEWKIFHICKELLMMWLSICKADSSNIWQVTTYMVNWWFGWCSFPDHNYRTAVYKHGREVLFSLNMNEANCCLIHLWLCIPIYSCLKETVTKSQTLDFCSFLIMIKIS